MDNKRNEDIITVYKMYMNGNDVEIRTDRIGVYDRLCGERCDKFGLEYDLDGNLNCKIPDIVINYIVDKYKKYK